MSTFGDGESSVRPVFVLTKPAIRVGDWVVSVSGCCDLFCDLLCSSFVFEQGRSSAYACLVLSSASLFGRAGMLATVGAKFETCAIRPNN